ncbi:MAG: ABC transporter permease [Elusimicrobiota bacterium]
MTQNSAKAPSAQADSSKKRAHLLYLSRLREMTLCEWKIREQSTLYGFLWTLLNPLLTFCVLYVVFTKWMGSKIVHYPAYLLIGVVQYNFFQMGTSYGLSSLRRRSGVILNFILPRELVTLSAISSIAISHLFEFTLMLGFCIVLGVRPAWSWLALPAILLLLAGLVASISFFLAILQARYQDFERIWAIIINTGFFLTPIFYTMDVISPARRRLLWLNPMTPIIQMTRLAVIGGRFPSLFQFGLISLLTVILGLTGRAFFRGQEAKIGDYVSI